MPASNSSQPCSGGPFVLHQCELTDGSCLTVSSITGLTGKAVNDRHGVKTARQEWWAPTVRAPRQARSDGKKIHHAVLNAQPSIAGAAITAAQRCPVEHCPAAKTFNR